MSAIKGKIARLPQRKSGDITRSVSTLPKTLQRYHKRLSGTNPLLFRNKLLEEDPISPDFGRGNPGKKRLGLFEKISVNVKNWIRKTLSEVLKGLRFVRARFAGKIASHARDILKKRKRGLG